MAPSGGVSSRTGNLLDEVAYEVAASFRAAPSSSRDPKVLAAYRALEQQSDGAFEALTRDAPERGVRVVFTRCERPYDSDREMVGAARAEVLLEVTTAATELDRCHPLLGCELGGAYDRFRAVHDLIGHVGPGLGFDRGGELAAWRWQERRYHGLAPWALATELHAEHSVLWTTGAFSDHKATLLDRDLLARSGRAGRKPTTAPTPPRVHDQRPSHRLRGGVDRLGRMADRTPITLALRGGTPIATTVQTK
jgi:hypothetical protein